MNMDKITLLLLNASVIYEYLKQDFDHLPEEIKYAANEMKEISKSIFVDTDTSSEVSEMFQDSEKPTY